MLTKEARRQMAVVRLDQRMPRRKSNSVSRMLEVEVEVSEVVRSWSSVNLFRVERRGEGQW